MVVIAPGNPMRVNMFVTLAIWSSVVGMYTCLQYSCCTSHFVSL